MPVPSRGCITQPVPRSAKPIPWWRVWKLSVPASLRAGSPSSSFATRSTIGRITARSIRRCGNGHGTSQGYTLTRLSGQFPALYERICNGESSANAAAIEAGFRTRKIQIESTVEGFRRAIEKHLPAGRW